MTHIVERAMVTVAVIASFTAIVLSGHLYGQVADIMGPLMGALAVAWFSSHQSGQAGVAVIAAPPVAVVAAPPVAVAATPPVAAVGPLTPALPPYTAGGAK